MGITLEQFLVAVYEPPNELEQRERFKVEDKDQANWALRRLAVIRREQQEIKEQADREVQRVEAWLNSELDRLNGDAGFFESLLHEYHGDIYEKNPRTKTIKLPAGSLKFRAQQPSYVRNEDKLVDWLKSSGREELVRTKESADWGALKKDSFVSEGKVIIEGTGEVVEGVTATERPPKFTVEVDLDVSTS